MGKFICPLPFKSLSLEAGYKSRICCHDLTGATDKVDFALNDDLHQKVQKQMLNGEIPENCSYCKKLEDSGAFSPRQDYIAQLSDDLKKKIEYLDITIDSNCNLTCRMCSPAYSSPLEKVFDDLGLASDKTFLSEWKIKQQNFDKLLPELKETFETLKRIVITGGEPFISKNTESLINALCSSHHAKNITIRFFSNTTSLPGWLPKLLDSVKKVEIYMSIDGVNDFAKYIRFPSNWNQIKENIRRLEKLMEKHSNLELRVHTVLQALNLSHLPSLINEIKEFSHLFPYIPSFTLLEGPRYLKASVLPQKYKEEKIEEILDFLKNLQIEESYILKNETSMNLNSLKAFLEDIRIENIENQYMDFLLYNRKFDSYRDQKLKDLLPNLPGISQDDE